MNPVVLRTFFVDKMKAANKQDETRGTVKGPLSIGWNLVTCVPAEQLDETMEKVIGTESGTNFDADDIKPRSQKDRNYKSNHEKTRFV